MVRYPLATMNGEDQRNPLPPGIENRSQVDNALRAIQAKKPVPEIDFTLHTMEDGSQVSTLERVCKGTSTPILPRKIPLLLPY